MSTHLTPPQAFSHRKKTSELAARSAKEISLTPKLLEMVRLRVAQICDCQFCVDTHKEVLKAQGESDQRIQQLKSWRESLLYNDRERTAMAISEALGSTPPKPVSKDIVRDARGHFNDAEILELTLTIFAVTDWNYLCAH